MSRSKGRSASIAASFTLWLTKGRSAVDPLNCGVPTLVAVAGVQLKRSPVQLSGAMLTGRLVLVREKPCYRYSPDSATVSGPAHRSKSGPLMLAAKSSVGILDTVTPCWLA